MFCQSNVLFFVLLVASTGVDLSQGNAFPASTTTASTNELQELYERIGESRYRLSTLESKITQLSDELKIIKEKVAKIEVTDGVRRNESLPKNCKEVFDKGNYITGTYIIRPQLHSFTAFCDMSTSGGGWTVFQNRFDGSQNFYLTWNEYQNGFGDFTGEFWLGLEHIHQLTENGNCELLVQLTDWDNKVAYARYNNFRVGDKAGDYAMTVDGYLGDSGDSLSYHTGMKFSTKDRDNDQYLDGKCAAAYTGAWWYNACHLSNLNGRYLKGQLTGGDKNQGIIWRGYRGEEYSLKKSRMMVRPR